MDKLKQYAKLHPLITSWAALALGMVIILVWSAKDVGFTVQQWIAVIITTILLAGACVWIISWGDDEELEVDTEEE